MAEGQNEKCKGHLCCSRKPYIDGLCEFHLPVDHEKALPSEGYDALLIKEIEEAAESEKGTYALHWHGFVFPVGHVLFGNIIFNSYTEKLARSWINIQEANIQGIQIAGIGINTLILSDSVIHADTVIGVTQIETFSLGRAIFQGKFHCASKTQTFDARNAVFEEEFSFGASIYRLANFSSCRFYKSCLFFAAQGSTFGNDSDSNFRIAGFDNAIFGLPSQTLFQDVDLRKASFKSVSLVGVRFYNTNFYQHELKRNGLFNEIEILRRINNTGSEGVKNVTADNQRRTRYDHLIHEYRQLRMAMETNKDYVTAHDFYVGEMEARQKRKWNPVLGLYRLSSFYGTNYARAFGFLLILLIIHFMLTIVCSTNFQVQKLFSGPDVIDAWGRLGDILIHTISTGTLQRSGLLKNLSFSQNLIDVVARLVIPIQAAMFVLALRNKTKR